MTQIIPYLLVKEYGIAIDIDGEPDECDRPKHRFKHIRWFDNEYSSLGCVWCGVPVLLASHPSIGEIPRYVELNGEDERQ